jgi:60 kDa SS-A/Ro ribonucleoprotein
VHPIQVLAALLTYQSGHSARGTGTWNPVSQIVEALDAAFYAAFAAIEPTGQRWLLGLDVSGSMGSGVIAGVPGLTPRVGSVAMAMVTARTEQYHLVAFTSGQPGEWRGTGSQSRLTSALYGGRLDGLTPLTFGPRQRLDDLCRQTAQLPMGGTDCALPMIYAMDQKVPADVFAIYTDSETWAGAVHPVQALRAYRQAMGIPAKLIVVGMVANEFSIADPNDGGMLDVVGFDTAAPEAMALFAKGL